MLYSKRMGYIYTYIADTLYTCTCRYCINTSSFQRYWRYIHVHVYESRERFIKKKGMRLIELTSIVVGTLLVLVE